eukprot:12909469-Prorocentrum_lima.AAC.1
MGAALPPLLFGIMPTDVLPSTGGGGLLAPEFPVVVVVACVKAAFISRNTAFMRAVALTT